MSKGWPRTQADIPAAEPLKGTLVMQSYANSAGTVGVALGLWLVKDATSSDTLAQAAVLVP